MAIYHFSTKPIKRSDGRSAVASAAYRAGERLRDERTGILYDYSYRKAEALIESWIQAPEGAGWAQDREGLWNAAEFAEKRKNSRPAREVEVALPVELTREQQNESLHGFVSDHLVSHGVAADVCIHRGDPNNPHAHIMLTTREAGPAGLGEKVREMDRTRTTELWREGWELHANRSLELAGRSERISCRSHRDRGIYREPTTHEGPHVRAMEERGVYTDRGSYNRGVILRNLERDHQNNDAEREELRMVEERQREDETQREEEARQQQVRNEQEAHERDKREEDQRIEERRRQRLEREARELEEEHEQEM